MVFIEAVFKDVPSQDFDVLIALLSQWEHNGIAEEDNLIKVYFSQDKFPETELEVLAKRFSGSLTCRTIQEQNWNREWEESFQPVVIDDFCGIRAAFHPPISGLRYELIITPKMSFGTGHHATTALMIRQIGQLSLKRKQILDFGCGTGVLSVLAAKMGATYILALDNDEGAVENALENVANNGCMQIEVKNENISKASSCFDCIFANINRNVLLAYMELFPSLLTIDGYLLLSGFYVGKDEEVIKEAAESVGLKLLREQSQDKWSALMFQK